jgi:hypothetical protein
MVVHALVRVLQVLTLAGVALTAIKLHKTGLRRRYPVFTAYCAFWALNSTWPLILPINSWLYYRLWVYTEPVNWLFYVLVVRELCGLVLEKFQGLRTLGRWAIYAGTFVAVSISIISLLPRIQSAGWKTTIYMVAVDRGITLGLVVFLILMMFLLKGYPVRLSRNLVLHAFLYTTFFVTNTLDGVLANLLGKNVYTIIDTGAMLISAACAITWFLFLNPSGEDVQVTVPLFTPRQEERILQHLEALNATMLRVSRK